MKETWSYCSSIAVAMTILDALESRCEAAHVEITRELIGRECAEYKFMFGNSVYTLLLVCQVCDQWVS